MLSGSDSGPPGSDRRAARGLVRLVQKARDHILRVGEAHRLHRYHRRGAHRGGRMPQAAPHRAGDVRIPCGRAQIEGEHDTALVVGPQRLQQRFPRRRRPDRLWRHFGLDPAAAQGLFEGAAVLSIQDQDHKDPRHGKGGGQGGHDCGPNA